MVREVKKTLINFCFSFTSYKFISVIEVDHISTNNLKSAEDEHDVVWFWLEKGKPWECPVCSQYFKVIDFAPKP